LRLRYARPNEIIYALPPEQKLSNPQK